MTARYVVGIDLGTTNCVLSYCDRDASQPDVQILPIPQLIAAGTVDLRSQLPSFLYLPPAHERGRGAFGLPWSGDPECVIGEFARSNAAMAPDRTIAGSKSWLCHSKVDRRQSILPWTPGLNSPQKDLQKVSPVVAAQRILEHLRAAWEHAFPEARLNQQLVIVTVPASFDAAARELTREAALAAGLPDQFDLLEEPQAAIYSWLVSTGDRWRRILGVNDTLLVCDVGGGTSDLTMVGLSDEQGELQLRRIAVGNHLLVGGDNMDLALAHRAAELFAEKGLKLDAWQSISLWHASRQAKESLLAGNAPPTHPITILGRGSRLIGGTVTVDMEREVVEQLLIEGFFPHCQLTDSPARRRSSGFQDVGLPFETDTGITRHVASFVRAHSPSGEMPVTHILFNGGVFKAAKLKQRLLQVVQSWQSASTTVCELQGEHDLDFAVARGAAYYGWAKEHGGVRIRGGTARSYYIGIETSGLAIPGMPRPLRALCVVPFGMEEGTQADVPSGEIGIVVGEPAQFRFFASSVRQHDRPGDVLDHWDEDEIVETDPLETTLPTTTLPTTEEQQEHYLPVTFQSRITELGMFELWCVCARDERRWKLEFNVRPELEA